MVKIMEEDGVGRLMPRPAGYDDGTGTVKAVDATHGLPVNVISGSAAGTEYVEDAVLPADPAGGALMLRQAAAPASQGAANGDAVALGGTAKGEAFVKNADLETLTGAVTETAPATDTASSGLNGRLQRIAQRLTSLIALVPASLGRKAASASLAVVPAGLAYGAVAASQTAAVIGGGAGAIGDFLSHVVIQPATTAAGTVTLLDNATVIFTFTTGTLADLRPIIVPFNAFSVSGAWKITTGANVSATGFGNFT